MVSKKNENAVSEAGSGSTNEPLPEEGWSKGGSNPCPEEGVHPWAEDSGSEGEPLPPQEIAPRPADERRALDVTCPDCRARPGAPCIAVDLADARLGRDVHAARIEAGRNYIPPRREELAKARGDESARPLKVDDVVIFVPTGERGIVERHPRASDPDLVQGCLLVRFRSGAQWVTCNTLRRDPSEAGRLISRHDDGTYPDADDARAKAVARVVAAREPAPDFSPAAKALILKMLSEEHESGVRVGRAEALGAVNRILTLMIGSADIHGRHAESETLREARRQIDRLSLGEVPR